MPSAATRPVAANDLVALSRDAVAALDALLADATAKYLRGVAIKRSQIANPKVLDR